MTRGVSGWTRVSHNAPHGTSNVTSNLRVLYRLGCRVVRMIYMTGGWVRRKEWIRMVHMYTYIFSLLSLTYIHSCRHRHDCQSLPPFLTPFFPLFLRTESYATSQVYLEKSHNQSPTTFSEPVIFLVKKGTEGDEEGYGDLGQGCPLENGLHGDQFPLRYFRLTVAVSCQA